jgi:membrane associated rhomboid family serine protease
MLPLRDHLPTRVTPWVNYALITLNIGVFVVQVYSADARPDADISTMWALVPARFVADPLGNLGPLFGHMFLHGGLAHIAGNMLYLWIFGDNVEDALGHWHYLFFYLACGIGAALAQIAADPHTAVSMLGASGAISGVLAAYMLLYPRSPITVLNPIPILWLFWGIFLYLPAWFVIAEFFVVNLWHVLQPSSEAGGVAFVAHIGGFVVGLALSPLLRAREPLEYGAWDRFLRDPR